MLLLSAKKNEELIYYNKQTDSIYIIPFDQRPENCFKTPYVFVAEMLCILVAIIGVWTNFLVFSVFNILAVLFIWLLVRDYKKQNYYEVLEKIENRGIKVQSMQLKKIDWLRRKMLFMDDLPSGFVHRLEVCSSIGPFIPIIILIVSPSMFKDSIAAGIVITELWLYFLYATGDFERYRFKRRIKKMKRSLTLRRH